MPRVKVGHGNCSAHHGELLQGTFTDTDGGLVRGLVTLPCPLFSAWARAELRRGPGAVRIFDPAKVKARSAAILAVRALALEGWDVHVTIQSSIPVAHGFGSSTADVVAVLRALSDAAGSTLAPERLAALAVRSERASDPLMLGRVTLFAQREGRVLEELGPALPGLHVLGFFTADEHGYGVDTLVHPPARYGTHELETFAGLREELARSIADGDACGVARVAAASARINQSHLPVERLNRLEEVAGHVGAAGFQVAHTGDIGALLFDGGNGLAEERASAARLALRGLGIHHTWSFDVGGRGTRRARAPRGDRRRRRPIAVSVPRRALVTEPSR